MDAPLSFKKSKLLKKAKEHFAHMSSSEQRNFADVVYGVRKLDDRPQSPETTRLYAELAHMADDESGNFISHMDRICAMNAAKSEQDNNR